MPMTRLRLQQRWQSGCAAVGNTVLTRAKASDRGHTTEINKATYAQALVTLQADRKQS